MSANAQPRRGASVLVLAVTLTVVAGATDVASFTRLGGAFASVMTGNLTLLGLATARASASLATHILVALAGYIVGVGLGTRAGRWSSRGARWETPVTVVLLLELVAYAGLAAGWELTGSAPAGGVQFALVAAATFAMGLQATALRQFDTRLSTTYLTGTLTASIASLITTRNGRQNRLNISVLIAHAAGATAAGLLLLTAPAAVPALPLVALAAVIASQSRSTATSLARRAPTGAGATQLELRYE